MTFPLLPTKVDMETVLANSYKDFHTKGLDYICLYRTPDLTIKIYLMEGVVSTAAEVVNPHDHRYIFDSYCLAGRMTNYEFVELPPNSERGRIYEAFEYMTPLNGGDGFTYNGQARLEQLPGRDYTIGQKYRMVPSQLHTIQVHGDQTALMLLQYRDEVPLDKPTQTFSLRPEMPSLSGLYSRFTADQIRASMAKLARVSSLNIEIE